MRASRRGRRGRKRARRLPSRSRRRWSRPPRRKASSPSTPRWICRSRRNSPRRSRRKFPGITVRVERSGAERVFQRIGQEMASGIHAVDVVNSADGAHFIVWKRNNWLAPYLPEEVARHYPAQYYDPDGLWVTTRVWLSSLGYNTNLVKPEEAPRSFADLLDPK